MSWSSIYLQVTCSLLVGSAAIVAYYVSNTVLKCRRALQDFTQRSCGLPILEESKSRFSNHGVELHLGRNTCHKLTGWHEKYGKTFGWLYGAQFCASTIDLDLIKLIGHDEQRLHINRMPFKSVVYEFEHDNIFLAENEQWRRIRRAFAPGLKKFKTPNMISEIETAIGALSAEFDKALLSKSSSGSDCCRGSKETETTTLVIDVEQVTHRFSLDIVFRCLYKQSNLIDHAFNKRSYWVDVLDEALRSPIDRSFTMRTALAFGVLSAPLDWMAKNLTPVGVWLKDVTRFIAAQTKLALETRRQLIKKLGHEQALKQATTTNPETADANTEAQLLKNSDALVVESFRLEDGSLYRRFVVDYIIDQFLDGKLSRSEYLNSSFLLFNAADKTVSDALSHTLYYLSVNQQVQEKLRASLKLEGGLDSEYLTWVINESLRLHPPAPIGCSRTVARDIKLANGNVLPAGTYVITPLYTIHRLKEFWGADANEYKPERWQDTSRHHPMQFLPFGAGLRACPGRDFALFQMRKLLLELISKFNFECAPKDDIDTFDSPYMLYTLPYSRTLIKVTKNHHQHL